jgi:hypothetical protein
MPKVEFCGEDLRDLPLSKGNANLERLLPRPV